MAMERETVERALHDWPIWHESVETSRVELGYNPLWTSTKAIAWIEANYPHKIRPRARREVERLGLPPNFQQYWEDCFYSNYRRSDGRVDFDAIRRRVATGTFDARGQPTDELIPSNKSLPPLPFQVVIEEEMPGGTAQNWLELRVGIFEPVASHELVNSIAEHMWATLRSRRFLWSRWTPEAGQLAAIDSKWGNHPLGKLIRMAKTNRSLAKSMAVERYHRGEADFETLLREEWILPETQAELEQFRNRWSINEVMLGRKLGELRKKIYNRVYRRLSEPRPKLGSRGTLKKVMPDRNSQND